MEYLILGLLVLSPMTGYALQQFIRQNLALICSHSAGSVQTALAKLQREGKVAVCETSAGRRRKKVFSVTPAGRAAFDAWVAQPMQAGRAKNMELSHLFFLGLAQPDERVAAIRAYVEQIAQIEAVLHAIRARFDQMAPDGADWEQVRRFQGYTIDYGIAAARFEQDWYRGLLAQLEETR